MYKLQYFAPKTQVINPNEGINSDICGMVEKQVLMTSIYVYVNFRLQLYMPGTMCCESLMILERER
jgi:hypothetical protein